MESNRYTFKFTKKASLDYEGIYKYISQELYAIAAADNLINKMETGIRQLCVMPFIGSCIQDVSLKQKGYRKLLIDNYIIFYIVDETKRIVYIMRILYGAMDYMRYL